ncbi:ABC transporter substrate-binding protein [Streptomyces sp. CA-210063]|uniref:ABC transporter substrate-binding protein n=1 Tax=Streptomyces sp. CA-210063 TaxID=2801029 RepID=UPI00214C71A3|nr:ABC transporter substrate-binding protein [Streptomyces sp. CA-210063]UUU29416.1 ABC transporter substrate-binding protein [Streptomyces sp. CA-210063]
MVDMDRRAFGKGMLGLSFAALLTGAATGCSTSESGTGGGTGSKVLTLALDFPYGSFDPAKQASGYAVVLPWQACFDTLLRYEPDGTISPGAAESFTANDDNTELTLKLRSGMKFTDGTVVDAAAVKASLEHMKNGGGSDSSRLADVTVTVKDSSTVVLTTPKPNGLLPTFLCLAPGILSSKKSHTAKDRDTRPVGSGPYTLDVANTTMGSTYTFVRNEDHWDKAAYPYHKVIMREMADITARVNALKSGQVDCSPVTSQTSAEVKGSGLVLLENSVNWAGLFLSDPDGKVIPALKHVKVRRAINMIFDRPAILKALFQGNGKVTNQIFHAESDAYLADMVDHYPYDVAKAKALMEEAGFERGFSFDLPVIPGQDFATPLIVQQMALLGIKAKRVELPANQVLAELLSGKYPIFFLAIESRSPLWDVVQAVMPGAIWNVNHASDSELQPLLDKAQVLDGAAAKENAQAVNRWLVEQAWFCPWVLPTNFYATDKQTSAKPYVGSVVPYLHSFKPSA